MNQQQDNSDWGPLIPYHAPRLQPRPASTGIPVQQQAVPAQAGRGGDGQIPGWVPWGAKDILAIILLVIAAYVVVIIALGFFFGLVSAIGGVSRDTLAGSPFVTTALLALQWVIIYGVAISYFRMRGYRFNLKLIGFRRPPSVIEAIALAVGLMLPIYILIGLYSSYVTPNQPPVTSDFSSSVIGFILAFIEVALLVPIVEESFFRGVIHQGLEKSLGFLPGALCSATIFALAHFAGEASLSSALTIFVPIFILGFAFAWLMHHTHSLLPSVIGHFIFNAIAVVGQYFFLSSGS